MKRALLIACAALWTGCPAEAPQKPSLSAITPGTTVQGLPVEASLKGKGFAARVKADLDDPDQSEVSLPTVQFVLDGARHPAQVLEVSSQQLRLRTPAALTPGVWDVELKDPWSRTATLREAFEVTVCAADAACDDGLDCTLDACVNGGCTATVEATACLIDGQCVAAGQQAPQTSCQVCDPAAANSTWTPVTNGTACDDGSLCTVGDACVDGACQAGAPKTCDVPRCRVGECQPSTGECVISVATDDAPCDDGYACTTNDACAAGICRGTSTCANVPPQACLKVAPVAAAIGQQVSFDARCSTDLEDPAASLVFRFDFEGDGTFSAVDGGQAVHTYADAGLYVAAVEVVDTGGLSATAVRHVSVGDGIGDVVVTTGADEDDLGATPAMPGGTGLSLREAILYANATSGVQRIRFTPGLTVRGRALPELTTEGISIVGEEDVLLDFGDQETAATCITLAAPSQSIVGARVVGCAGSAVDAKSDLAAVVDTEVSAGGVGIRVSGAMGRVGPGVSAHDLSGAGVEIRGTDATVEGVRSYRNKSGVRILAQQSLIRVARTTLWNNAQAGIEIGPVAAADILACTIHQSGTHGLEAQGTQAGLTIRSSLFTGNTEYGISSSSARFDALGPNGYFGNGTAALSSGTPNSQDLQADPLYLSPENGDFRLTPGSPAIDAGVNTGVDLNGPAPGLFNGPAPDLGAEESSP